MKLVNITPTPKGIYIKHEHIILDATISNTCLNIDSFIEISLLNNIKYNIVESGTINFYFNNELNENEYRINIDEKIKIYYHSDSSLQNALSSLYQLIKKYDDKIIIPKCTINDEPDLQYRGLLIDCARSMHSVENIKKYIVLCWKYKLNYIQLHLSDDESFRLPIKKYPKLTSDIFYTEDDIKELNDYSKIYGIEIIPEIDTPGHSTVMQKAYPEIFGDKGILAFTKESIKACSEIYTEVCDLFSLSRYIHIGGDEGRLGWWVDWKECNDFGETLGINKNDIVDSMTSNEYLMLRYLAYFIKFNAETIKKNGKEAIVWEGFHKITNDIVPKDVKVMVFDSSYQLASDLINSGYEIINCSWLPTYIVTPTWYYSPKQCFDWDVTSYGTINPQSPFCNGMIKMEYSKNMIGGQLNSWGDTIEKAFDTPELGQKDEYNKIAERIIPISENLWNIDKRISWENFTEND